MDEIYSILTRQFKRLAETGDGLYKLQSGPWYKPWKPQHLGYLSIERSRDRPEVSIMWTSHKDSHNRLYGPCKVIVVSLEGFIRLYMEQALSMWILYDRSRPNKSLEDVTRAMATAEWMETMLIERAIWVGPVVDTM